MTRPGIAQHFTELACNKARLLSLLKSSDWITQQQAMEAGGMRFGARIKELREMGYIIERQQLGPRKHFYRLVKARQGSLWG